MELEPTPTRPGLAIDFRAAARRIRAGLRPLGTLFNKDLSAGKKGLLDLYADECVLIGQQPETAF